MCKVTVILCSAKRSWCYPWCPLRHLLGTSHKPLLSGHAVGMSHHLGALDSKAQHAPSFCWGPVIHSNWGQLLTTLLYMFSAGVVVCVLGSQHVCTSFHENVSMLSHVLCHLYLTSMMCAPQHLVKFCNSQCGFHYVSLTPQCWVYS